MAREVFERKYSRVSFYCGGSSVQERLGQHVARVLIFFGTVESSCDSPTYMLGSEQCRHYTGTGWCIDGESQAEVGCCWKARTADRGFASPPGKMKSKETMQRASCFRRMYR